MTINYGSFTLREAEEMIVGCAMVDEYSLTTVLELLPANPFRCEIADDLRTTFYTLVGWHLRDAFDATTNEDRLTEGLAALAKRNGSHDEMCLLRQEWSGFLDSLWNPYTHIPGFIEGLCIALVEFYRKEDALAVAAHEYSYSNTLSIWQQEERQAPRVRVRGLAI